MKKNNLSFWILAAPLLLGACAREPQNLPADPVAGKALFAGYGCATCHKVGNGGGILGPDLTAVGFRKSPEWLDLWMKDPHSWKNNTLMPNFFLKDQARKNLVAYLSTLKGEAYRQAPPWDSETVKNDPLKRGEMIFNNTGCVGCHGTRGKGGYPNNNVVGGLIPSLTFAADGYSKEELVEKIKKGSHPAKDNPAAPDPMISMPTWSHYLKDDEIESVADYLISLRPPKTADSDW